MVGTHAAFHSTQQLWQLPVGRWPRKCADSGDSSLCLNHQALLLNQSCPIDSVAIMAGDDWKVEDVIQHLMKR